MPLIGVSRRLAHPAIVPAIREAARVLLPLFERCQGPQGRPLAPPVFVVVDDEFMDGIYPPESALLEFAGTGMDDARRAAELVGMAACFTWDTKRLLRFGDAIDLPFRPRARARMIAFCPQRIDGARTWFDNPPPYVITTTVVLAHELVHWFGTHEEHPHPWFEEAQAQIVARRMLEALPNPGPYLEFQEELARKQPAPYRAYLDLHAQPKL